MKPAPVRYACYQPGFGSVPGVHLWHLTAPIDEHPAGDTLSERTINQLGYEIPRDERVCAECYGTMSRHMPGCRWPE